eukprot:1161902-Pelagomonas_calceolata.AAC.21
MLLLLPTTSASRHASGARAQRLRRAGSCVVASSSPLKNILCFVCTCPKAGMRRELELEAEASSQLLQKAEAFVREAMQAATAGGGLQAAAPVAVQVRRHRWQGSSSDGGTGEEAQVAGLFVGKVMQAAALMAVQAAAPVMMMTVVRGPLQSSTKEAGEAILRAAGLESELEQLQILSKQAHSHCCVVWVRLRTASITCLTAGVFLPCLTQMCDAVRLQL